jgi:hypothetical protein
VRFKKAIRFSVATQGLRLTRRAPGIILTIVNALLPEKQLTAEHLRDRMVSQDLLLRSRLRLDCTVMAFMRHYWSWIALHDRSSGSYLFVDGSPASGFEAMVAYEHFSGDHCFWNRLSPINYLGYGFMGMRQKTYSLLWKLFLETGPNEERLRFRLSHIRGMCTDMGTESGIPDCRDCLQEFLTAIGCPLIVTPVEWLLPNCVFSSGWHHLLDHVSEEVLTSKHQNSHNEFNFAEATPTRTHLKGVCAYTGCEVTRVIEELLLGMFLCLFVDQALESLSWWK